MGYTPALCGGSVVSTKQARIAELAHQLSQTGLDNIHPFMDLAWLTEAYHCTRKDGAPGVDGVTWAEYGDNLASNLASLLNRAKSGTYRAPPVKRAHIPKGDGETRPIGIPTLEDRVLQRAVVMLLEPIVEREFLDCSYGYRPGRSAHQAVATIWKGIMSEGTTWVVDIDIRKFFDTIDMRKGCASLAAMVENALGHDPYAGDIFVFVGRRKNRVKLIAWDRSGFWIAAKHLEQGTFAVPQGAAVETADGTMPLSPAQIQMLLEGIDVHRATYHAHYHRREIATAAPSA